MPDPNMQSFFDQLGTTKLNFVAALVGSILSLPWIDKSLPLLTRWIMVAGGFCGSIWGTPWAVEGFGFPPSSTPAVAFALGMFAMSLADATFKWIKSGALWKAVKGRVGL